MQLIEQFLLAFSGFMWGLPLVFLLVGGGVYFLIHSRAVPYRYFGHALRILSGRYDNVNATGDIPHYQALSTALSGTLGLGNIAGVAVAITLGGPGAIFWMWLTAIVGVATKFYTASLAIMFRGRDSAGNIQGGPMYVIQTGLGKRWLPLAYLFAIAGLIGTLPVFQVNQLTQIVRDVVAVPNGWTDPDAHFGFDLLMGSALAVLILVVILGHIQRIGKVTGRLVPFMVLTYLLMTAIVLFDHVGEIPAAFGIIFRDAFSGEAVASGSIMAVLLMGVRRGAFSNEAGIGTEALAHGAAQTDQPIREGLVAMMGPVIDTLFVCTCTALVILIAGDWRNPALDGITLTANAFETALPGYGAGMLVFIAVLLGGSTVLSMWYYGAKCMGFLFGADKQRYYVWIYTVLVVVGAVVSLNVVIGLIDGMYAVMAIPTMTSAIALSPKVRAAANEYFASLKTMHQKE